MAMREKSVKRYVVRLPSRARAVRPPTAMPTLPSHRWMYPEAGAAPFELTSAPLDDGHVPS